MVKWGSEASADPPLGKFIWFLRYLRGRVVLSMRFAQKLNSFARAEPFIELLLFW